MSEDEYHRLARLVVGTGKRYRRLVGLDWDSLIQEGWSAAAQARSAYYSRLVSAGRAYAPVEAYCSIAVRRRMMNFSAASRCPVTGRDGHPGLIMHIRTASMATLDLPGWHGTLDEGLGLEAAENARRRVEVVRRVLSKYGWTKEGWVSGADEMDRLAVEVLLTGRPAKHVAEDWGIRPVDLRRHVKLVREQLRAEPDLADLAAEGEGC